MRSKLKTNRVSSISTPLKVVGVTAGLVGIGGIVYKTVATGLNEGFGPSAGFARGFSELSPLNIANSSILAGTILTSVGALLVGASAIFARK